MTGRASSTPTLRPYLPADTPMLAEILQASVEELTGEEYTQRQQQAWASMASAASFADKLAQALTLLATMDGSPVGFISLKDGETIAMFYVHPSATGAGVGSMLYDAVERLATARGAQKLTVDASDNARPFFDKRGFRPQSRNTVPIGDEWLGNTTMSKSLVTPEDRKSPS